MNRWNLSPAALAVGAVLSLAGHAAGQCFSDRIIASDPGTADLFGVSVAVTWNGSSNNLIMGSPQEDAKGTDAGAVYCYTDGPGDWWEFKKLTASDGAALDYFGNKVAIDANSLLVAAPGAGPTGRVYLYDRFVADWIQTATFTGAASGDGFGNALAIDGNIAVVGAPYNDGFGSNSGASYVYERVGGVWSYKATLVASSNWRHPDDWSGFSVDVDGVRVISGIPNGDDWNATDCGFAQMFVKSNGVWSLDGGLYAPDHQTGDDMGWSVAVEGDTAVVGAPGAMIDGKTEAGAVYVFRRRSGGWSLDQKLTAFPAYQGSRFGTTVALDQGVIAVGCFANEWVYTFEEAPSGAWAQMSRVTDPDGGTDKFGAAIALHNRILLVGDHQADDAGYSNNGAAYVFELNRDGADVCEGATPVVQGTYTGCTTNATLQGFGGCPGGLQTAPDIYFSYIAPATGTVTFDTFGSSFNTVLSVHDDCPASSDNAIACNDDWSIFEDSSSAQVFVVQGREYFVRVSGKDGDKGGFFLHVSGLTPYECPADYNLDGTLNTLDFIAFLNGWNAHDPASDFNGDGNINTVDVLAFLNAFTAGC